MIATKIIASYPNGRKSVGDSYIGAIAAVLGSFPASVVRRAHLCPGGVPAEFTSIPSPAHVIRWCEANSESLHRRAQREERVTAQLNDREIAGRTPRGIAMTTSWLDRTDPEAARMSGQESRVKRDVRLAADARAKLIAEIGQEAFDAIPDAR